MLSTAKVQCPRDAVEGKRIKDQPSLELRKFSQSLTDKVRLMQRKVILKTFLFLHRELSAE